MSFTDSHHEGIRYFAMNNRKRSMMRRASDPEFVPSLRLLIERERYSLTDVGMMFGVSRERARQWCKQYGITPLDSRTAVGLMGVVRIWDDEANRFVPVRKQVAREYKRTLRRQEQLDVRAAKRQAIVERVITLRRTLGRDPTVQEIAEIVAGRMSCSGECGACLRGAWGGNMSYAAAVSAIRKAAGIQPRPRGWRGWVHQPTWAR